MCSIVVTLRNVLPVVLLSVLIAGCNSGDKEMGGPVEPSPAAGKQQPMDTPPSSASVTIPAGTRAEMEAAYKKAKDAFAKAPTDDAKKALIEATNNVALKTEFSEDLSPKEKYGGSLKYFREVLKLDPTNATAKANSQQIIDIYKSMGRPVPGGG
jgi:hypothetical protein